MLTENNGSLVWRKYLDKAAPFEAGNHQEDILIKQALY